MRTPRPRRPGESWWHWLRRRRRTVLGSSAAQDRLDELLAAAAAPVQDRELEGEEQALQAFRRAFPAPPAGPAGPQPPESPESLESLDWATALSLLRRRSLVDAVALADQVRCSLYARVAVEQAKGVLVHRWGIDVEEAAVALQRYARRHRQPLEAVARQVVDSAYLPDPPTPSGSSPGY